MQGVSGTSSSTAARGLRLDKLLPVDLAGGVSGALTLAEVVETVRLIITLNRTVVEITIRSL